jgi:hypothetical protein
MSVLGPKRQRGWPTEGVVGKGEKDSARAASKGLVNPELVKQLSMFSHGCVCIVYHSTGC